MAARPTSASSDRAQSYGRGGAGNIRTGTVAATPDLTTPSIKSDVYTTGRGGQGNMSKNDPANPDRARASQDVKATPRRLSQGQSHYGRGGAANTIKMAPEEIAEAEVEKARIEREAKEKETAKYGPLGKVKGLADKGKEMLMGGK